MLNAVGQLWPVLFLFIHKRFLEKVLGHLFEQWPKCLFKQKKEEEEDNNDEEVKFLVNIIYQLLMETSKRYFKVIH